MPLAHQIVMAVGSILCRSALVLVFAALGCSGGEGGNTSANDGASDTSGSGGTSSSATNGGGTTGNTSGTNSSTTGGSTVGSSTTSSSTTGGDSASSGSGGSTTGGSSTSGGGEGGDLGEGQCRSVEDCLMEDNLDFADTRCASPYEPSGDTVNCGAPDWCGQCDCPIQAPAPEGENYPCDTDDDCFAWGDTPNASLCRSGRCVVCQTDEDCSVELPRCGSQDVSFGSSFTTCVECASDDDCAEDRPRCVYVNSVGPSCVECFNTSDCATGVCSDHRCVPGCTSDDDCPNPATGCSDNARCEARDCSSNGACPPNTACTADVCVRRPCSVDSDCEGACVNGKCYEYYGTCSTTYAAP